jgi:arsenate reductase
MSNKAEKQITVYGLGNCDSCRKARTWLKAQQIEFQFLDVRKDGVNSLQLTQWLESEFAPNLINQRSTSWRQLSDAEKKQAQTDPVNLLMTYPALIKRPVFLRGETIIAVGFKPDALEAVLNS